LAGPMCNVYNRVVYLHYTVYSMCLSECQVTVSRWVRAKEEGEPCKKLLVIQVSRTYTRLDPRNIKYTRRHTWQNTRLHTFFILLTCNKQGQYNIYILYYSPHSKVLLKIWKGFSNIVFFYVMYKNLSLKNNVYIIKTNT
jgi:hypothetical protein